MDNFFTKSYYFLEESPAVSARAVRFFIVLLICASLLITSIEFFWGNRITGLTASLFFWSERTILFIFSVEIILRGIGAPIKKEWSKKGTTVIDFLAIIPGWLELIIPSLGAAMALRTLRLFRGLRFLRVLRLFRYRSLLQQVFQFQGTILEKITPVITLLLLVKVTILILENKGWWISNQNLDELFAIAGFSLGIILSQKIGVTYNKFIQVEETITRITGTLFSFMPIFPAKEERKTCQDWAKVFRSCMVGETNYEEFTAASDALFVVIKKIEPTPSEVTMKYSSIIEDAMFCLSKKTRLTPKAYDTLLHQATFFYLLLVVLFIPGFTGIVSTITATYILYGMYHLTRDLDSILGGTANLINISIVELDSFINS